MKKSISKIMTIVLAFVAAICFVCAITMNASSAKADGEPVFSVVDANVYGGNQDADNSGIRFVAQVNKAAFDAIEGKDDSPVFFGIELSVAGKETVIDVCFNVAGNTTGQDGFNKIDFDSKDLNEYRATLMYDAEKLAAELQADVRFNPEGLDLAAYKQSEIFAEYMQAAYKTEITATAYYQIGDKTVAEKQKGGSLTCSIWGVASKLYAELGGFDDYATVEEKYFNDTSTLTDVTVNEYGTITGYTFDGTEKAIYLNGKPIDVTDNKISTDLVEGVTEGETLAICVVNANGELVNLNAEYDMIAETIATEAFYDAAENVIYYTDTNGEVKTITEGDLYYVGNENVKLEKGSVSFWYNDAFEFSYSYQSVANYSMLTKVAPRIGEEKVEIAYNPATDVYTGVSVRVENEGIVLYNLSNVVFVSQVIDDAAELKTVFNKPDNSGSLSGGMVYTHGTSPWDSATYRWGNITKGMYVLVKDIDASTGFTFDNSYFNFFEGVFDGRGHNIYNLNVSVDESTGQHGNGLFSAISTYSSIQNIGFIDVKANNGSVFMGNTADRTGGTYVDSPKYKEQVGVATDGARDDIKTVLASASRSGLNYNGTNYGLNTWSNVYVKVSDDTTKLMGVISRNMPNVSGVLRAANLVIEYNPTDASAYNEEGNGKYGVLFGAAYTLKVGGPSLNSYYDVPHGYTMYNTIGATQEYYTPTGSKDIVWSANALNFSHGGTYNTGHGHTIFVYSPVKLVSCVTGSILAMNETVDESNPYQFMAQNERSFLNRYTNRETASGLSLAQLNAYRYVTTGMDKYFVTQNGHFVWKNIPAEQA